MFLEQLPGPIAAVYEAGPTGFGVARVGRERGIDVRVVAPGSIPKGSGDQVKTHRRAHDPSATRAARAHAAVQRTCCSGAADTGDRSPADA